MSQNASTPVPAPVKAHTKTARPLASTSLLPPVPPPSLTPGLSEFLAKLGEEFASTMTSHMERIKDSLDEQKEELGIIRRQGVDILDGQTSLQQRLVWLSSEARDYLADERERQQDDQNSEDEDPAGAPAS